MHYFEFAVVQFSSGLLYIELAFQVDSSWREVRRQLPPLQLYAPVEDESRYAHETPGDL